MGGNRRGTERERQVRKLLEEDGYWTCRATGSLGDADILALKADEPPRMIEVKSTTASPFSDFPPYKRREMLEAAEKAGATCELVWWPPRKQPRWIPEHLWPPALSVVRDSA